MTPRPHDVERLPPALRAQPEAHAVARRPCGCQVRGKRRAACYAVHVSVVTPETERARIAAGRTQRRIARGGPALSTHDRRMNAERETCAKLAESCGAPDAARLIRQRIKTAPEGA